MFVRVIYVKGPLTLPGLLSAFHILFILPPQSGRNTCSRAMKCQAILNRIYYQTFLRPLRNKPKGNIPSLQRPKGSINWTDIWVLVSEKVKCPIFKIAPIRGACRSRSPAGPLAALPLPSAPGGRLFPGSGPGACPFRRRPTGFPALFWRLGPGACRPVGPAAPNAEPRAGREPAHSAGAGAGTGRGAERTQPSDGRHCWFSFFSLDFGLIQPKNVLEFHFLFSKVYEVGTESRPGCVCGFPKRTRLGQGAGSPRSRARRKPPGPVPGGRATLGPADRSRSPQAGVTPTGAARRKNGCPQPRRSPTDSGTQVSSTVQPAAPHPALKGV